MNDPERNADPLLGPDVPAGVIDWLDAVTVPLLLVAADRLDVVAANAAARMMFGLRRFERLPVGVDAFGSTPAVERLAEAIRTAETVDGESAAVTVVCQLAAGVRRLSFAPARCPGLAGHWLFTLTDPEPSEHGDWRTGMEEIVNLLPVGVEVYDRNLNALFYNRRADELFLYDEKAILHHDEWFELGFPDAAERAQREREFADRLAAARRDPEEVQQTEWLMRCRDGSLRSVQFLFRFVGDHFVMVLWDMTERRQLEAELRRMAETDPLTGLANRRAFFEKSEAAFAGARAVGLALSVLVIDIDHFKAINDRYGHAAGDTVIEKVAEACAAMLRPSDVLARIGGEEFAVLLSARGEDEAAAVAGRLLGAVTRRPITVGGREVAVTVSIGVATRRPSDAGFAAMLARADAALYVAKNTGRGRVVAGDGGEEG
jgi:diguanylate cyclase (GGDEF)-like protein